jgi:hypothetical protein
MIKNIYGDYICISRLDDEFIEEYKKEFFSKIEGNNKGTITTKSWRDCSVKSSYFNEPFINNCSSIDSNMVFSKRVSEEMERFFIKLNEEQNTLINIPVHISKIWYNEYNYNDFQESHCHSGRLCFYSFVYILKCKDINVDSKLVFENPRSSHLKSIIIGEQMNSIDNYKDEYVPNLSEGDLIIFPSHMKHYVRIHKNKNDSRITISGNINMRS